MAREQAEAGLPMNDLGRFTDALPGVVSEYATADASEDRAELFHVMVTHPDWVARRCAEDSVLERKKDYLLAKLGAWEPAMGLRFWASLE